MHKKSGGSPKCGGNLRYVHYSTDEARSDRVGSPSSHAGGDHSISCRRRRSWLPCARAGGESNSCMSAQDRSYLGMHSRRLLITEMARMVAHGLLLVWRDLTTG